MAHDPSCDSRRRRLEEDGLPPPEILDAWGVPDVSAELNDRLASIPFTTKATIMPSDSTPRPVYRSRLLPVAGMLATAAALLLSFWLGRRSVQPASVPVSELMEHVARPSVAPLVPDVVRVTFVFGDGVHTELKTEVTGSWTSVHAGQVVAIERDPAFHPRVRMSSDDLGQVVVPLVLGPQPEQVFSAQIEPSPADTKRSPDGKSRRRSKSSTKRRGPRPSVSVDCILDPSKCEEASTSDGEVLERLNRHIISASEEWESAGRSGLRIGVQPGHAPVDVRLDGRPIGKTPVPFVEVEPGVHVLEYDLPGGEHRQVEVRVRAGSVGTIRLGRDEGDPTRDPLSGL